VSDRSYQRLRIVNSELAGSLFTSLSGYYAKDKFHIGEDHYKIGITIFSTNDGHRTPDRETHTRVRQAFLFCLALRFASERQ